MLANLFQGLVALFIAIVVIKLVQGGALYTGLLKAAPGSAVQPERVQLLALISIGLMAYVIRALEMLAIDAPAFPEVPVSWLWILVGSQLLYVAGKYIRKKQRR